MSNGKCRVLKRKFLKNVLDKFKLLCQSLIQAGIAQLLKNKNKKNQIMKSTAFIELTELWQDGDFEKVGLIINKEKWNPARVAEFCAYVMRYLGSSQANILYKFL